MRLQTIIEACTAPIMVYDKQGRTTYVNPGFEKIFGWQAHELINKPMGFVPKDQAELTRKAMERVIAGETVSGIETQRKTKLQETIHVLLSAAPLRDEAGDFDGTMVTLQDITDLVRSRQEALEANQAKSEFLSNVSHEIRIPLNHVMGMADLLLNTQLDQEQQEFVEILQKSTKALMGVVNDMLDYSRIEAEKVTFDRIGFDLRTLVERIKDLMAEKSAKKGLDFQVFVHQLVPSLVMGDPGRLRQVLVNLGSNAIKFTEKGSVKINISLEKEDKKTADILFEIIDTGIGIAQDRLDLIFDSFVQADGSETRKYGGTGLGLSISNKLVQMMGRTIEVRSSPDKGSTFFFTLTFDKQDLEKKENILASASIQGKKILVVDENATDRQVLKTLILDWGCFLDEAATSLAALGKCENTMDKIMPFDVVLLSKEMKGMEGEVLAKQIKANQGSANTIIIVLASMGKRGDVARLQRAGVRGYLPKPVRPRELYDCIATALATKNSGQKEMITRHTLNENKKQHVHILLYEPGRINRKIVLNILGKSGYSVKVEIDGNRVFETFKTGQYNMVLMDINTPGNMDTVQNIRSFEKKHNKERVPIIAITDSFMAGENAGLVMEYMDDSLAKPLTPEGLLQTIEKWTWQDEKFLTAHIDGYSRMKFRKNQDTVFNFTSTLERAMDDRDFLEMLVNEFMADLPGKIDGIKDAVLKKDIPALIIKAQSLKGSSANMGADMINAAALSIEKMGEVGDLDLAEKRIKHLETVSRLFKEHIGQIEWSKM
jgi:two-component system sensor histidine kinase/response regulator